MTFKDDLLKQGLEIPYSIDMDYYRESLFLYGRKIPNRIGILPLEGFDSNSDGSPSEHVYRRYLRFVEGGAGLIWFEACSVSEDGKSNPGQMMLTDENVESFKKLLKEMDAKATMVGRAPCFKVLQLTHSGRVSRNAEWEPIPLSPKKYGIEDDVKLATDETISRIIEEHIHAAVLAVAAGFDAVDIKVCHGYFLC